MVDLNLARKGRGADSHQELVVRGLLGVRPSRRDRHRATLQLTKGRSPRAAGPVTSWWRKKCHGGENIALGRTTAELAVGSVSVRCVVIIANETRGRAGINSITGRAAGCRFADCADPRTALVPVQPAIDAGLSIKLVSCRKTTRKTR